MTPSDFRQLPEAAVVKRVALWAAVLGGFVTPFMGSAVNIALPSLGQEFSLHAVGLSWVATAYLLAAAMFLLPFGKLADILGRKKVYLWGLAVYTLASLLCGLSASGPVLIGFRALQGLGGAMIFSTSTAILTSVYPPAERGRALGWSVSATYLGLSLGPVAGGFLTQQLGWRSIFLFNVPLGLAVWLLVAWKLNGEWAEADGERFDLTGSLTYGLALAVLIYGFSRLPGWPGAALIAGSIIGFLLFGRLEARAEFPMLDLGLFRRNRVFAFSSLAALINYSATFAVGFLLSLYLQYVRGLTPQQAGLILIVQPLFMSAFSPLAGGLADRFEARIVASLGMALTVAGMLLLCLLADRTPMALITGALIFMGLGFALFSSPNTHAVMSSVEKRHYGVASATLGTMRLTGQMFSLAVAMLVMAVYFGQAAITPALHGRFLASLRTSCWIFAALCLSGVFASLARGRRTSGTVPRRG